MNALYLKEKIIVSACLLGEFCRYDGQTKEDSALKIWLEDKEVIPFCPEDPVLGTPREAITVVQTEDGFRLQSVHHQKDVTDAIKEETLRVLASNQGVNQAILKSKSPSCGCGTTPIYNQSGVQIGLGDGLAATLLKKNSYTIRDENNYKDER